MYWADVYVLRRGTSMLQPELVYFCLFGFLFIYTVYLIEFNAS